MLQFVFDIIFFVLTIQLTKQTFRTPIGLYSKISPIITQYVMDDLLHCCIPKCGFDIPFLYKYVDDLVIPIPIDTVDGILTVFSSYSRFVQVTVKMERHNWVPFWMPNSYESMITRFS